MTDDHADRLAPYEEHVAANPDVKRKGKAIPYTWFNGHMFSFLAKDGTLSLRLAADEREAFLEKCDTQLSVQNGAFMKEYAVIPDDLLERTDELKPHFDASFAYVGSLKPKPTKKRT
jgi:hypothetical protein